MVTVIKFGKHLRSPFHYNENKVRLGVAEVIHAAGYGKDTMDLTRRDRIARLEKQAALNSRARVNSVHITLNFDPSEKLDKPTLQTIVDTYMSRIGYSGQPYLVYQHKDAGHPHVHVVSTNIRPDGSRIPTNNIGRILSEPARKEIEVQFGLVRASDHALRQAYQTRAVEPEKVQYGRTETRRAITIILDAVLPKSQFTSLAELNAILRKYNVLADDGSPESRVRQHGGLVYRVLDDKGNKVGVPIKASDIYSKPTLKFLKQQFVKNETLRQASKARIPTYRNMPWTAPADLPDSDLKAGEIEKPASPKPINLLDLIPHSSAMVPDDNSVPEQEKQKRRKKKRKRLSL